MTKKRTGEPWIPAGDYGRSLPKLTVNLIVKDVAQSVAFYSDVLACEVLYADPDFAAMRALGVDFMLHADHAYDDHPWHADLSAETIRGLGAELRLFGIDPDAVEGRAREYSSPVLKEAHDRGHGWREAWVQDPDGYVWAVGKAIGESRG
jgi:catechol 2,3-dioxygenase-like lactoylglutathione lyase family enzyme